MALCVSCGKELKDGAKFCPFCGAGQPTPPARDPSQAPTVSLYGDNVPPAPSGSPAPVTPAPSSLPPVPPVPPAAPPLAPRKKKKSKAPLIIGIVLGAVLLLAGLALLFLFVILPRLQNLGGGGLKEVYGKYPVYSVAASDGSGSPAGEWVELKKNGLGTFFSGNHEFDMTWALEDEAFSGTVSFMGIDSEMTGTLKNGILSVKYGSYSYVFVREGAEPPKDTSAVLPPDTGSEPAGEPLRYIISHYASGDTTVNHASLTEMGYAGAHLTLDPDGTGLLLPVGSSEELSITWEEGVLHVAGQDVPYSIEGDFLTFEYQGLVLSFVPEGYEFPAQEIQITAPQDPSLISDYEGDWHGVAQIFNCTGDYADNDFALAEVIMRLSFSPDGSLSPYLRMALEGFENRKGFGSSDESLNFPDLEGALEVESESVRLSGHFFGGALGDPTYAVLNANGSLTIYTTVTSAGGSFDLYMILRRPDEAWSDEDDLRLTDEEVKHYLGMSLDEIASEFNLDASLIPEYSSIGERMTEGAPAD